MSGRHDQEDDRRAVLEDAVQVLEAARRSRVVSAEARRALERVERRAAREGWPASSAVVRCAREVRALLEASGRRFEPLLAEAERVLPDDDPVVQALRDLARQLQLAVPAGLSWQRGERARSEAWRRLDEKLKALVRRELTGSRALGAAGLDALLELERSRARWLREVEARLAEEAPLARARDGEHLPLARWLDGEPLQLPRPRAGLFEVARALHRGDLVAALLHAREADADRTDADWQRLLAFVRLQLAARHHAAQPATPPLYRTGPQQPAPAPESLLEALGALATSPP